MSLDEQLSRLLEGDLPEEEAAALRTRIRNDPEVARAYDEMRGLVAALSALPETAHAPPLRVVPIRTARSRVALAAPWLLAAAAGLAWWMSSNDPEVTIGVEPMTKMVAGLAGAAVTVAVYEGTAIVRAEGKDPVTLAAGQSRLFGGDTDPGAALPTDRAALQQRLADLERQLAATREALQLEQFSGALTRGQLAAEQGTPSAWPSDVPATMRSDRFAAELASRLEGISDVEVEVVDCAEFPCIAAVRYLGTDPSLEWGDDVAERIGAWTAEAYGSDHSLSLNRSKFVEDDREARYIVFGAHGVSDDPNLQDREKWRIGTLVEQLGEQLEAGEVESREAVHATPPGNE